MVYHSNLSKSSLHREFNDRSLLAVAPTPPIPSGPSISPKTKVFSMPHDQQGSADRSPERSHSAVSVVSVPIKAALHKISSVVTLSGRSRNPSPSRPPSPTPSHRSNASTIRPSERQVAFSGVKSCVSNDLACEGRPVLTSATLRTPRVPTLPCSPPPLVPLPPLPVPPVPSPSRRSLEAPTSSLSYAAITQELASLQNTNNNLSKQNKTLVKDNAKLLMASQQMAYYQYHLKRKIEILESKHQRLTDVILQILAEYDEPAAHSSPNAL